MVGARNVGCWQTWQASLLPSGPTDAPIQPRSLPGHCPGTAQLPFRDMMPVLLSWRLRVRDRSAMFLPFCPLHTLPGSRADGRRTWHRGGFALRHFVKLTWASHTSPLPECAAHYFSSLSRRTQYAGHTLCLRHPQLLRPLRRRTSMTCFDVLATHAKRLREIRRSTDYSSCPKRPRSSSYRPARFALAPIA